MPRPDFIWAAARGAISGLAQTQLRLRTFQRVLIPGSIADGSVQPCKIGLQRSRVRFVSPSIRETSRADAMGALGRVA